MCRTILLLLPLLVASAVADGNAACTSIQPSLIGVINSAVPNYVYNAVGEGNVTSVYKATQLVTPGDSVEVNTIIKFDKIPATAKDCQLEVFFSKGYYKVNSFENCRKIDVWKADDALRSNAKPPAQLQKCLLANANANVLNMTWNNAPQAKEFFGTVDDFDLPKGSEPFPAYGKTFSKVIKKCKCEGTMTFRVAVSKDIKQGGIEFRQEQNPFGGWQLKYNC